MTVSPSHDGGLLGSAQLAWDVAHGTPLKIAVYAQGSSSPVLALEATDISFGSVPDSDIAVSPPAGAKIVDLSSQTGSAVSGGSANAPVTGLAAVQAAAPFPVVAPDTLVGLPRRDVRLVGPADSRSVLVIYGQGLGAIIVVERKPDAAKAGQAGMLDALPSISLDGVTAHELATQLGTVLTGITAAFRTCSPDRFRPLQPRRRRDRSGERRAAARSARTGQALRRHRRRRPRRSDGRTRRRLRLPRPERRRQDDLAADAARADPADRGPVRVSSAATRSSTERALWTGSPVSSRARASIRICPAVATCTCSAISTVASERAHRGGARRRRVRDRGKDRVGGYSHGMRQGSVSLRLSFEIRSCCCSTSPRPASTPQACATCASS